MSHSKPHFFLRSEVWDRDDRGEWKFVLTAADGSQTLEAHDAEPGVRGERLELLSVVRALEALDQPSIVTLAQGARSVRRVLGEGLDEWRRNGWMWECYGELTPIKNRDLWQRLDRALAFHRLETRRVFRFDRAHAIRDDRADDDLGRSTAAAVAAGRAGEESSANVGVAAADEASANGAAANGASAGESSLRWKKSWHRMRRRVRDRIDGMTLMSGRLGSVVDTSWGN